VHKGHSFICKDAKFFSCILIETFIYLRSSKNCTILLQLFSLCRSGVESPCRRLPVTCRLSPVSLESPCRRSLEVVWQMTNFN